MAIRHVSIHVTRSVDESTSTRGSRCHPQAFPNWHEPSSVLSVLRSRIDREMAISLRPFALILILLLSVGSAISFENQSPAASKAISDLRDVIVKGLGLQAEEGLKVSGFDVRDTLVGHSVAYEFDIAVGNKQFPIKLLEDVSRWDVVDFPIFSTEMRMNDEEEGDSKGLADTRKKAARSGTVPVLPPFQLAGPMELWIQDGDDMRLSLPHDVEAGALKKILLSDGAVVTVKGARSVSLRHPLELPLPLNRTYHESKLKVSGLLHIAQLLRNSARNNGVPLLSLRIVGPTSLTSPPSMAPNDKLKLKRLAPGLVELSSRSSSVSVAPQDVEEESATLWPLTSLNGSNANIRGFEELLASVLGKKGEEEGTFKLLRVDVSARTYVKMGFKVERRILDGGEVDWSRFPEWKTRPEKSIAHFEVLAVLDDNGAVIPERIAEVEPFKTQESFSVGVQTGNVSVSHLPIIHPPPVYFTL